MREWNYVTIHGQGVYVGDSLSLYNRPKIDYATTTHWYAFDDARDNGQLTPAKVRAKVAQTWVGPDDVPTKDTP